MGTYWGYLGPCQGVSFTGPFKGACVAQGKRGVGGFRVCRVFKSWEMTVIVGLDKNVADDDSLMTF